MKARIIPAGIAACILAATLAACGGTEAPKVDSHVSNTSTSTLPETVPTVSVPVEIGETAEGAVKSDVTNKLGDTIESFKLKKDGDAEGTELLKNAIIPNDMNVMVGVAAKDKDVPVHVEVRLANGTVAKMGPVTMADAPTITLTKADDGEMFLTYVDAAGNTHSTKETPAPTQAPEPAQAPAPAQAPEPEPQQTPVPATEPEPVAQQEYVSYEQSYDYAPSYDYTPNYEYAPTPEPEPQVRETPETPSTRSEAPQQQEDGCLSDMVVRE